MIPKAKATPPKKKTNICHNIDTKFQAKTHGGPNSASPQNEHVYLRSP